MKMFPHWVIVQQVGAALGTGPMVAAPLLLAGSQGAARRRAAGGMAMCACILAQAACAVLCLLPLQDYRSVPKYVSVPMTPDQAGSIKQYFAYKLDGADVAIFDRVCRSKPAAAPRRLLATAAGSSYTPAPDFDPTCSRELKIGTDRKPVPFLPVDAFSGVMPVIEAGDRIFKETAKQMNLIS
jgi:hypothetical protein